jgi:hypothetical protein
LALEDDCLLALVPPVADDDLISDRKASHDSWPCVNGVLACFVNLVTAHHDFWGSADALPSTRVGKGVRVVRTA